MGCFAVIEQIIRHRWAPHVSPRIKSDLCRLTRSKHKGRMGVKTELLTLSRFGLKPCRNKQAVAVFVNETSADKTEPEQLAFIWNVT